MKININDFIICFWHWASTFWSVHHTVSWCFYLKWSFCLFVHIAQTRPPHHGDPADEIWSRPLHHRRWRLPSAPPGHPLPTHGHSSVSHGQRRGQTFLYMWAFYLTNVLFCCSTKILLLMYGCVQEVDVPDSTGQTPLMLAAQKIIGSEFFWF